MCTHACAHMHTQRSMYTVYIYIYVHIRTHAYKTQTHAAIATYINTHTYNKNIYKHKINMCSHIQSGNIMQNTMQPYSYTYKDFYNNITCPARFSKCSCVSQNK